MENYSRLIAVAILAGVLATASAYTNIAMAELPKTTLKVRVSDSSRTPGNKSTEGITISIVWLKPKFEDDTHSLTYIQEQAEFDEFGVFTFDTEFFESDGQIVPGIYRVYVSDHDSTDSRPTPTGQEASTFIYIGEGDQKELEFIIGRLPETYGYITLLSPTDRYEQAIENGTKEEIQSVAEDLTRRRAVWALQQRDLTRALEECETNLDSTLENVPPIFVSGLMEDLDAAADEDQKSKILRRYADGLQQGYPNTEMAEATLQILAQHHWELHSIGQAIDEVDKLNLTPAGSDGNEEQVGFAPEVFGGISGLTGFANVSYTNTELPSDSGALGVIEVGAGEFPAIRFPVTVTGPTFSAGLDGDFTEDGEYSPDGFRTRLSYGYGDETISRFYMADPGVTNGITYWEQFSGSDGISANNAEVDATSTIELTRVGFTLSARWDDFYWPNYSVFVGAGYEYSRYDFDQMASLTDLDPGFAVFDVGAMNYGHLSSNFPHISIGGEMRFDVTDRVEVDLGWNSDIGVRINSVWGTQMTNCYISFDAMPATNLCPNPTTDAEIDDSEIALGFTFGLTGGITYHLTEDVSARLFSTFNYDSNIPTLGSPTNLADDGSVNLGKGDGYVWGLGIQLRYRL